MFKNFSLTEFLAGAAIVVILGCVFAAPFLGARYTVKVRGEIVHENAKVYESTRNNSLTVFDNDGTIHTYNGNWELIQEK